MMFSLRKIRAVWQREFLAEAASPTAWVFLVIFLELSAFLTFIMSGLFSYGQADLSPFFEWFPWLFLFIIPALGMPLWSEERKTGSFELSLSFPVTLWELALGKFLAGMTLLLIALLLTVSVPLTALYLGRPDPGAIVCGYFGALLLGAVAWFAAATGYLASSGDGVMSYHYKNFFFQEQSSLLTVIEAVFLNPMKAVQECLKAEKLEFIAMTLLPLLGLPLLTRRYERYILLIPYVLVNLMPAHQYQYNIYFQYTFGSAALLLYLTIVNLADIRENWQRMAALGTALALSMACFGVTVLPKGISYPKQCLDYADFYSGVRSTLAEIPADAGWRRKIFGSP